MSRMRLTAVVLCFLISCSVIVAGSHWTAQELAGKFSVVPAAPKRVEMRSGSTRSFAVRGRTSTWDVVVSCRGYRCRCQSSRHSDDANDSGHLDISAVFDTEPSDITGE